MLGNNVTHANFSVDNLEAAKAFYVDKLGFKPLKEQDGNLVLESGAGTRVNIYEKPDHQAWDSTVLGIEVQSVEEALRELSAIGVEVEKLPGTNDLGIMVEGDMGEAAWFKDPAGNWVCVSNLV